MNEQNMIDTFKAVYEEYMLDEHREEAEWDSYYVPVWTLDTAASFGVTEYSRRATYSLGTLAFVKGWQPFKGATRRDLAVMDFGDARIVMEDAMLPMPQATRL